MSTGALAVVIILVVLLAAAAVLAIIRRRRADDTDLPSWETEPRPSLFDAAPEAKTTVLGNRHRTAAPATAADRPRNDAAEPAAPRPADGSAEPRVRGLLLLNLPPAAGLEDIERAPPLGARHEIVERLRDMLPGLEFTGGGHGHVLTPDHEVRIDIGTADPTPTAVAAASGAAGIEMLQRLLARTGWRAYAARTGSFLSAEDLARADERSLQEP